MKPLVDLNMNNEKDVAALRAVLRSMSLASIVAIIQQAIKKGDDYEFKDIQVAVAQTPITVDLDNEHRLAHITARDLRKSNVRKIQRLFKTVRDRGTKRFLDAEANDYLLQIKCVYIDKRHSKSYMFFCDNTPVFASSDGDDDLQFVIPFEDCHIDISAYSDKDADYEAMKQIDKGITVSPLLQEDYELENEDE